MQFLNDNIPPLVKASSTTLTLASTYQGQPTTVTVGGQSYLIPATLTLNTATVGANGLDAGSLGSSQSWYVYAVVNQSTFTVALVASLSDPSVGPTHPSGYGTAQQWIGGFTTNGGAIASVLQGNQVSSPVSSPNVVGRTDGVAPAAGYIGESITVSPGVAPTWSTSGTATNVVSYTLQPGEYDVSGFVYADLSTGTWHQMRGSVSTVSATHSQADMAITPWSSFTTVTASAFTTPTRRFRVATSSTLTIYLVASVYHTTATGWWQTYCRLIITRVA